MSSPIHLDEHAASIYAPRSVRERILPVPDHTLRSRTAAAAIRERSSGKVKPKYRGDRAMVALQRQLARDPDLIPEPASEGTAVIRPLLVRLCGVTGVAALVAWSLVSYSAVKKAAGNISADTAPAIASNHVSLAAVQRPRLRPSQTDEGFVSLAKPASATVTASADAVMPASGSITGTAAREVTATGPAPSQAAPSQAADTPRSLRLDSDQIETVIKRGNDLLAIGDLAAARLLFRRAAEAGSAQGALALAMTFDPIMLQRLGAVGAAPDLAQARQWYQRAAELGSSAASQHLAGLGDVR